MATQGGHFVPWIELRNDTRHGPGWIGVSMWLPMLVPCRANLGASCVHLGSHNVGVPTFLVVAHLVCFRPPNLFKSLVGLGTGSAAE